MADALPLLLTRTFETLRRQRSMLLLAVVLFATIASVFAWLRDARLEQFHQALSQEESVVEDVQMLDILQEELKQGNTDVEGDIRDIRSRLSLQFSILAGRRSMWVLLQSPYFLLDVGPFLLASLIASLLALLGTFLSAIQAVSHPLPLKATLRRVLPVLPSSLALMLACFGATLLFIPALSIAAARAGIDLPPFLAGTTRVVLIFFSYFVAILVGPRLALAPAFLTSEHRTVRASLRQSWKATEGYWNKILWECLIVIVGLLLARFFIRFAARELFGQIDVLFLITYTFLAHLMAVVFGVFLGHLAKTIQKHQTVAGEDEEEIEEPDEEDC